MEKKEIIILLQELGAIYSELGGPDLTIGICGGAALIMAGARWCMTHDVSDGFRVMLKSMLAQLGYGNLSQKI